MPSLFFFFNTKIQQTKELQATPWFVLLAKKSRLLNLLRRRDNNITCYHFYSHKPYNMCLIRCLHLPAYLYTIDYCTPFNIFRYNRRSRQNLSLSVQSCHSKAIFHLSFLIFSQQVTFSLLHLQAACPLFKHL